MIHPTVFIGLGTTGKNILEYAEGFIREQYGIILDKKQIPSLPVFEFLVFETDESSKPYIPLVGRTKIEVNHINIPNVPPILGKLDTERSYLRQWIDEGILKQADQAVSAGAKHSRMIGRLCLWENWAKVTQVIGQAVQGVTAAGNREETDKILQEYYLSVGIPVTPEQTFVDNLPCIHIVGTLCGGTCSGTFLDIAFFARHLAQVHIGDKIGAEGIPAPKIRGWFTILDSFSAANAHTKEETEKQAGNCWAALKELEYYQHPETEFQIQFPGHPKIFKTHDLPFDRVFLVSPSGNYANLRVSEGMADLKALNHMVALGLYSETVADLLAAKEAIVTDTDKSRFSTFGIASAWFPKYQIAEAAASKRASDVFNHWLSPVTPEEATAIGGTPSEKAQAVWDEVYKEAALGLTQRQPEGTYIAEEIKNWFLGYKEELLALTPILLQTELAPSLDELAAGQKYDAILSERGQYERIRNLFRQRLSNAIYGAINEYKKLSAGEKFVTVLLQGKLKTTIGQNISYPNPKGYDLFGLMARLKPDIWSYLLKMHREVEKDKKYSCLREFQTVLLNFLKTAVDYHLKKLLEELYSEGKDCWITQRTSEVNKLKTDLQNLAGDEGVLEKRYIETKGKSPEIFQYQRLVFQAGSSIDKAIETLYDKLPMPLSAAGERVIERVLSQRSLYIFLKQGISEVEEQMVSQWRVEALNSVNGFNIATTLSAAYAAQQASLLNWASYSRPMLEISGELPAIKAPGFLIGRDDTGNALNNLLNTLILHPGKLFPLENITIKPTRMLEHLLILYQEQPGLEIHRHLIASPSLLNFYELHLERLKEAKDRGVSYIDYLRHIHRDGPKAFDLTKLERSKRSPELLTLAHRIFSWAGANEEWESKVFDIEDGKLKLAIPRSDAQEFMLTESEKANLSILISEAEIFERFQKYLCACAQELEHEGCNQCLNKYISRFRQKLQRQRLEPEELAQKVNQEQAKIDSLLNTCFTEKIKGGKEAIKDEWR